jgi:hypothetical protein
MSARKAGLTVLAIQLALVLSIGVKYAWERHRCPMVWVRAGQYDPSQPLRGRYIALTLHASACGLTANESFDYGTLGGAPTPRPEVFRKWRVVPAERDGQLAPIAVDETRAGPTQQLLLSHDVPCEYARLSGTSDFFIPEHAKSPFPLKDGQMLWALVTVPPSGPVRPVKLAISDAKGFHVLNLD